MSRDPKVLYIGTNRYIAALDPRTGEEVWRTKLPHSGPTIVTILIKDRNLFVGHAGRVYCLDKRSGEVQWENGLSRMGYHPVLLAMEGAQGSTSSGMSAAEAERRRRAAAASGA